MTETVSQTIDQLSVNTIRFLAADAVQRANSGHPGAPMGAATIAHVLWDRFLKHNPVNPAWPDRDRFVLSAGHASMLLYALLHLHGYDLTLEDIRNFRQWESKTPGHPEWREAPGVEMTTGPLGQGFAHGVGMAIAERHLAARYNKSSSPVIDHYTYALVSDGDLQEGVAAEAASLAGTLKLGKLIYLYDSNDIQIEGATEIVFTEDVAARFRAYGWQVLGPVDGFDVEAVASAIATARDDSERPSLIICKTVIGYGSPTAGTAKTHGEPLGKDNLRAAKERFEWPLEPDFYIPVEVAERIADYRERGAAAEAEWQTRWDAYRRDHAAEAEALAARLQGELPSGWDEGLDALFGAGTPATATRSASGKILNTLAPRLPALMGGSADLGPSNKTNLDGEASFTAETPEGRNMHFGVREHAMAAIAGGMALHDGCIPYVGTFLTFSDYMRPSIRLAALMGLRVIYVFTHDSIGLGEDGPTHQPVEHLMALRAIPNLTVIRPSDATETTVAWRCALENRSGPTALILTRQNIPVIDRRHLPPAHSAARGGYTLFETSPGQCDLILIASGSEVAPAIDAAQQLADGGAAVRVVAMPSFELFAAQSEDYRQAVLPPSVRTRVAIEAGVSRGWEKFVGLDGIIIGLDRFGASAPAKVLFEKFGFTAKRILSEAQALQKKMKQPNA